MKFRVCITSEHPITRLLSIVNSSFSKTGQLYIAVIIYQVSVPADRKDMLGRGRMLLNFYAAPNNSFAEVTDLPLSMSHRLKRFFPNFQ